jgi:hypothetical protein
MKNKYDEKIDYQKLKTELEVGTLKEQLDSPYDTEQTKQERFLKLRDFVLTMLDLKKDNKQRANCIINNEADRILFNKLSLQLGADLDEAVLKNDGLKMQAEQMTKLRESHERHRNQAFDYCSTLKDKLKTFVQTVNLYFNDR